jgi:carbamoyltransferase
METSQAVRMGSRAAAAPFRWTVNFLSALAWYFLSGMTQYLGFPHYGDEYKVMGLAPYGKPAHMESMRKIVQLQPAGGYALDLRFFRHHVEEISYRWENGSPVFADLFHASLADLLGTKRNSAEPADGAP